MQLLKLSLCKVLVNIARDQQESVHVDDSTPPPSAPGANVPSPLADAAATVAPAVAHAAAATGAPVPKPASRIVCRGQPQAALTLRFTNWTYLLPVILTFLVPFDLPFNVLSYRW
jgi:hypothetical protein